jgi:hypothetical protein
MFMRLKKGRCVMARFNKRHGMTGTKEYDCWTNIKQRCENPKFPQYHNYGGRGIKVCKEWADDFMVFYEHVGNAPAPSSQVDRINNNGNYEPCNVRWTIPKLNARNKRTNRIIEHLGITATMAEHCERLGVRQALINNRMYNLGKSFEEALQMGGSCKKHGKRLFVMFEGVKTTPGKLAKRFNLHRDTVTNRIKLHGWTPEEAVADGRDSLKVLADHAAFIASRG